MCVSTSGENIADVDSNFVMASLVICMKAGKLSTVFTSSLTQSDLEILEKLLGIQDCIRGLQILADLDISGVFTVYLSCNHSLN